MSVLKKPFIQFINKKIRENEERKLKGDMNCPVCGNEDLKFAPLPNELFTAWQENGLVHSIFELETLNVANYTCPKCYSNDRDRLFVLYFRRLLHQIKNKKLLDFAPSGPLQKYLFENTDVDYRSADLYRDDVDDKVDITQMDIYQENQFDIFICSHILEHVSDDVKAMKELYRILKPGGWGIVMVPILLSLHEDYEDKSITTENARWKYFFQNDHLRIHSKIGFVNKLNTVGFRVKALDINYFGKDTYEKNGIQSRSVLYVAEK